MTAGPWSWSQRGVATDRAVVGPCRLLHPHCWRVSRAIRRCRAAIARLSSSPPCCTSPRSSSWLTTEADLESKATFLFAWLLLNFFWLALLRRPAAAALVSLAMIVTLILLSQFKYDKLMMTVNFVDVMILDRRHRRVLSDDLSRSVAPGDPERAGRHSGARLALVARSLSRAAARRRRRRRALPRRRRRHFDRGADGAARSLLGRRLCVEIRQFRRRCDRDLRHARLHGFRSRMSPANSVLLPPPAPASPPPSRRTSS